MGGVFISYRREDCPGHAGRLYDRLVERFGEPSVFMDVDAIEPGVDFGERIDQAVASCDVLLALIGREWLASEAGGRRRLEDPDDFVRRELATALDRSGLRVIPVLVEGATMPRADDLPDELKPLARRNAIELTDGRWHYDVSRLADVVARVTAPSRARRREPRRRAMRVRPRWALLAGAALLAAAAVAAVLGLVGGGGGAPKAIAGPVRVGGEAGRLAFGAGYVWVPVGTEHAVARVDPRTLKFAMFRGVGAYPSSVSTGEGAVWVADSGDDHVTRIDPRTGAVSDPIGVGVEPNDIAAGEGFVWTANCDCTPPTSNRFSVSRIDPRTLTERRIPIRASLGHLFPRPLGTSIGPLGIGTGNGNAWVADATNGSVERIDPRAAQVVGKPIPVGGIPSDVAVDRSGIWVALEDAGSVVRIDPGTLRAGRRIRVGASPSTLALGGGFLWIAHDDGRLSRLDLRTLRAVGPAVSAGHQAAGVAFGAGRAWVADFESGALRGIAP